VAPNKIKERFFAFFYILDRARDFLDRVNIAIKEYIHSFMIKLLQNAYLKINAAYPFKLTLLLQHVKKSFSPRHIHLSTVKNTLKTLRLKYQSGCHLKSSRQTLVNCQALCTLYQFFTNVSQCYPNLQNVAEQKIVYSVEFFSDSAKKGTSHKSSDLSTRSSVSNRQIYDVNKSPSYPIHFSLFGEIEPQAFFDLVRASRAGISARRVE